MTTQQTVGEIAATMPSAVRVFEKYEIDYCCGGKRPLGEVCAERGLSAEAVLAELDASQPAAREKNWSKAPLKDLIEHIVSTHHEYLKQEMPVLERRLARVVEVHGPNHGEVLRALASVYSALRDELDGHLRKEEMILFPAIVALEEARTSGRRPQPSPFGTVNNPIRMMLFEHDNAGHALAQMRSLTQDYTLPPDACSTYQAVYHGLEQMEADLHAHIHLENNILFPRAAELESAE